MMERFAESRFRPCSTQMVARGRSYAKESDESPKLLERESWPMPEMRLAGNSSPEVSGYR